MSLPSQTIGAVTGRSHMYRRAGGRRRSLRVFLIPIALIAVAWWGIAQLWPSGSDDPDNQTPDNNKMTLAANTGQGGGNESFNDVPRGMLIGQPSDQEDKNADNDKDNGKSGSAAPMGRPEESHREPAYTPPAKPKPRVEEDDEEPLIITPEASTFGGLEDDDAGASRNDSRASSGRAAARMREGHRLLDANDAIEGRRLLSMALMSGQLSERDNDSIRETLTELNERMVFSPEIFNGDQFVMTHVVGSGEFLSTIIKKKKLLVDWRFIARINRFEPKRMREGMKLKLITGPFHAIVHKRSFQMDIFLGDDEDAVYVCSLPVGLGEFNSTPEGLFKVRRNSKLINPEWINPRTRERFEANDPKNPIGEHWIGLDGIDASLADVQGYGIHGTIDLDSIGKMRSMGCIRMLPDDVALVYELLVEGASTVRIMAD